MPLGPQFMRHVGAFQRDALSSYMDTTVRAKLGIIPDSVKFGGSSSNHRYVLELLPLKTAKISAQSNAVFNKQSGDFMKPNWDTVDGLLMNGTNVIVYNGNQDLICDSIGGWSRSFESAAFSINLYHFHVRHFPRQTAYSSKQT